MAQRSVRRPFHADPSAEVLGAYRGKWVAVSHGKVIESGERALDVLRALDMNHPHLQPQVYRVPAGEVMLL
jgi:hypothetical protein